jgi:alpha-1,2-mannosyltransferase
MKATRTNIVLGLAAVPFLTYIVYRGASRGSDFKYPYGAARLLWTTGELHVRAQPRYPITLHVLLAPLTALPLGVAVTVWAVLSGWAVAALPGMLARLSGIEPRRQVLAWALVAPFFIDALVLGQSDPINLFLVSAGLVSARAGRGAAGACLVGLAGSVKILPFAHWGTLLALRPSRGVVAGIVLSLLLGFGLITAAVGLRAAAAGLRAQVEWVRDHEKPWHLVERGTDLRTNNESLPIVLARTFGDLPAGRGDPRSVVLARWPLGRVWTAWGGVLGVLGIGWLVSAWSARRLGGSRGWLGLFAVTSVVVLAATPICWHHYFLWTLPAALFLNHRRRLLAASAVVSLLGSASQTARGMGCHMVLALGLLGVVVHDLWRERIGARTDS